MNPVKTSVRAARFVAETAYRFFNRLRYRHLQVRTNEYEILNGKSHHYRTMIYFIGLEQQRRQLEAIGFRPNAVAFDLSGQIVKDTPDGTISFVAQK